MQYCYHVCFIVVFQTEVLTVVDKVALKPSEACSILLGNGCGSSYDPFNQNWTVPLPNTPKPPPKAIQPPAVCCHDTDHVLTCFNHI